MHKICRRDKGHGNPFVGAQGPIIYPQQRQEYRRRKARFNVPRMNRTKGEEFSRSIENALEKLCGAFLGPPFGGYCRFGCEQMTKTTALHKYRSGAKD